MPVMSKRPAVHTLLVLLCVSASTSLAAQQQGASQPSIVVTGTRPAKPSGMAAGPEVKGVISAQNGDKIKVMLVDGTSAIILVNGATRIKASGGFSATKDRKPDRSALLNGLPITVKTAQSGDGLLALQISFRNGDYKIATMIRGGTAQRFDEQAAATEALRGRMGDIDKYNIKSTTNVYFDTGKAILSAKAKADLCTTAAEAEATSNALMLVVGYTDSVGSDERNQLLSEKRAGAVINYLQQVCHWKPYRMLTPTGMAKADPLASNDTPEGKAQNRRVSVNILVSKGLDGL